jgi:hypothetical protein
MALQSSGQIKASEINSELGRTSSSELSIKTAVGNGYVTINTASSPYPDNVQPHQYSEWYSYDHSATSNAKYWSFASSGQGLTFNRTGGNTLSTANDICISFWIRPEWSATDVNAMLYEINNSPTATTNRLFLLYDYGLNRLVARLRTNGTNSRGTHWNLNSNSSQTGLTSGNWHSGNRGNVNSDGFAHIVITFDSSASTGQAAFDCYWNGSKLPNKLTNLTSTIFNYSPSYIGINRPPSGTGSAREAKYDNVAFFFNKMLSSTEITNLYNSGTSLTPADVGEDDNVALIFDAENDPPTASSGDDYTTTWSNYADAGSAVSY